MDEMDPPMIEMDPPQVLYQRRPRQAILDDTVDNQERWETFFSQERNENDFYEMARRLALENKTDEEMNDNQYGVPDVQVAAIQDKFDSINGKIQRGYFDSYLSGGHYYFHSLEESRRFGREICELRLLLCGREIPRRSRRSPDPRAPFVSISEIKRDVSATVKQMGEIQKFIRNRNRQSIRYNVINGNVFDDIVNRWDNQVRDVDEEWMNSFMARASTPNPGNPQNQNQDDYALGIFNLVEAYVGIRADVWAPDYNRQLNNRNRDRITNFDIEIQRFKSRDALSRDALLN